MLTTSERMYRVADPSCHPQISLCTRIQEKNRVLNWPPSKMTTSRTCHPKKMAESTTVVNSEVANCGLSHFKGWPVQDSVFFLDSCTQGNLGVARRISHPIPDKLIAKLFQSYIFSMLAFITFTSSIQFLKVLLVV